ncbi:SAR2788 family putative toxin [Brevibacterium sp. JSBI002]|uniref:SAR2788 family putative toxin n=1 Tax=Brevibacterium sp. JSBI002 TaxID=2886045 RepID=UPI00222EE580|nr:SAR2788 family putative toxin [Brevibacterium sp. JSBI002]UZD63594.1 SAR2788 family putative toxin [Brevibacterium sp. JSBI002]
MQVSLRKSVAAVAAVTALAVGLSTANISPVAADEPTEVPSVSTHSVSVDPDEATSGVESLDEGGDNLDTTVDVDAVGGTVSTSVEAEGIDSRVDVATDSDAPLDELIQSVSVEAVVDGEDIESELLVRDFTYLGDEAFAATLEDAQSGETIEVSSDQVNAQAFPILWVLGLLARVGIKAAIKQIGKTQIKKAAKSYLLNSKGVKWSKILAPKHKWNKVGAKSKEQVAEIMGKAMANGKHSPYKGGGAKQAVYKYKYKGKKYTVVVTYASRGGKISNGWVR